MSWPEDLVMTVKLNTLLQCVYAEYFIQAKNPRTDRLDISLREVSTE